MIIYSISKTHISKIEPDPITSKKDPILVKLTRNS